MHILSLDDLSPDDISAVFGLADNAARAMVPTGAESNAPPLCGTVGWSFEGNGIRTRTAFLRAFRELGLQFIELPNLLKTSERPQDLSGYLDPFYEAFVIREQDHARLEAFAQASRRPVINAMSALEHPCEVLTDAWFIERSIRPLREARIVLWGPSTNVFRSWHSLARVMHLSITQVCEPAYHLPDPSVDFSACPPPEADVVITDSLPANAESHGMPLTLAHLERMGRPALLPTPPFSIGRELLLDPAHYPGFTGYGQKALLLPMHKAILRHAMRSA